MTNKILMFTTRQMCYHSAGFFAAQMASGLEELGYECELCEFPEEGIAGNGQGQAKAAAAAGGEIDAAAATVLEQYIGKEYAAVIDFNSKLPRLLLEDNRYYLDAIDAPFYNYILDNPLYHHATLECTLKRYHVLLVDEGHCNYVRRYYPHIQSVHMLPLGANTAVFTKTFEQKQGNVLFMGTYRRPGVYLEQMNNAGGQAQKDMCDMVEMMQADTALTMEHALKKLLADSRRVVTDKEFVLLLNFYYPVEMYLRNRYREQLVTTLLNAGLPVRIVGDWWEHYSGADNPGLHLEKPVTFDKSFEKIAASALLADSSPFFQNGIHDRVFAGMANHTAVLTDNNPYLEKTLAAEGLIKTYPLDNPQEACAQAEELLINRAWRRELVDKAYAVYEKRYQWRNVAEKFAGDCLIR